MANTPPDDSGHRVLMYTPDTGIGAAGAVELLGRGMDERVTERVPAVH